MAESKKAVFLSYASQDAEAAGRISQSLRAAGVEVWLDQSELRGGDSWDQRIRKQIRDCALFIPVISAHTQARAEGYFRLEWDLADQRTHMVSRNKAFIVPVCIDSTPDLEADVPDSFLKVQWTRLSAGETPASFSGRIAALIAGTPITAQPQLSASPAAAPQKRPSHRWIVVTTLSLVAAGVVAWQLARTFHAPPLPAPATSRSAAVVSSVPDKSIAVLPFVDMSEKHDQEYFSDGLSEELIDHLSHNPNLKVIARTSSFAFKGKNEDMRTIATKLGVANLLEGSVRKAGTELRITAQLIRATDGVHLWSQTYERKLNDIFKIQDEISTTVAKELNVALGAAPRPVAVGTSSLEAYNLMLQGNFFYYRSGMGDIDRALGLYRQVTALEPRNALAWARIAEAYMALAEGGQLSVATAGSRARAALQQALKIDPDLARAHYVLGNMNRDLDLDWAGAKTEYERALALDAHGDVSADARFNSAWIDAFQTGRTDTVLRIAVQEVARNPLESTNYYLLAILQFAAGHLEESAAAFRKLLELNPTIVGAHADYAWTLLSMGRQAEALAAANAETDELSRLGALPCIYWRMGRHAESNAALKRLESQYGNHGAYGAALNHACRAEKDLTFEWLERAYDQRDSGLENIKLHPWLRPLHDDPRYKALLQKLKLSET